MLAIGRGVQAQSHADQTHHHNLEAGLQQRLCQDHGGIYFSAPHLATMAKVSRPRLQVCLMY
jgi:hypothetical protein